MPCAARPRVAATAALLAVLLAGHAAARSLPDPCFNCMDQPTCAAPEPQPGTLFTLEVERGHGSSAPPPPGAAVVPMLKELAAQRRTFSVKYLQRAFLEVNGKLIALGTFNSDLSNDTTHVFEDPRDTSSSRRRVRFRAVVQLRCNVRATEERLLRVTASAEADTATSATITFTYILPSSRACGLPPCASAGSPIPLGEYLVYKPPMVRQECPGTFLSAPSCKSGRSTPQLAPLGRLSDRQRWRIVPAASAVPEVAATLAAGDGIEDDLLGKPVFIQNLARSGQACAEHLGIGGARDCAETATVATLEQQAEEWVIELGPLGQTGSVVNEYYIRSKALSDAGCPRAYLCLKLSCDTQQLHLCSKEESGHSMRWVLRATDISATLARVWGLS